MTLPAEARRLLGASREGSVLVLTGAGISAESGVPTFRGSEGYWVEGSTNFHPMALATHEAFVARPDTVWAWYLHRRSVCHAARPNAAHEALVRLEEALGDRFLLVTQNVDGLHARAGSSPARTYAIHGSLDLLRCARTCEGVHPMPDVDPDWPRGRAMDAATRALLVCPRCGGPARPHVLWFDEAYDEPLFRFESSRREARARDLLVVIGTTGATNLPVQIASTFVRRRAPVLVIDPAPNAFSEMIEGANGCFVPGTAGALVPAVVELLA